MSHFTKILQFLNHPPTEIPLDKLKIFGSQLEIKLEMLVEALIRRALRAESQNKRLIKRQGALENEKVSQFLDFPFLNVGF